MKKEPPPKMKAKPLKGIKISDLEEPNRTPSPPHVPLSPPRQVEEQVVEQMEESHIKEQQEEDTIVVTDAYL